MIQPLTKTKEKTECFHCGDNCDDVIEFDEKPFCCNGCKTVYELLNHHDLETYYQLNQSPGTKQNRQKSDFSYLDNSEIASSLLDFESEKTGKITLYLPAIHCSSCIWLLENLPSLFNGVISSQVNFISKKATISFRKDELTLRKLVEIVSSIGYEPRISLEEDRATKKERNPLVIKLAIAGFCFGNSMLISIPTYLDTGFEMTGDIQSLFGLVNIILMLPIIFYSASDYYKSAYLGLRKKQVGIDVPVALGISILFLQTIFEVVTGSGSGYADSLTGLVFFLLIGKWYQNKSYQALSFERTFKSFFPIAVNKVDGENETFVPIENIKVNDCIRIRNGEVIPADGILVDGKAQIDYSFVSGEALPEKVAVGEKIFTGGRQVGASIAIEVIKEVSSGYLTDLWNHADFKRSEESGLQNIINRISGYFTLAILSIALLSAISWAMIDPSQMWKVVTSVMIIACPCALALALPFAYGHALRYLGRNKLYLKNADVVEKIARSRQIVFDKTGTLTKSELLQMEYHGEHMSEEQLKMLKVVCSNSMHPYSKLLSKHLETKIGKQITSADGDRLDKFEEIEGSGLVAYKNGNAIKIGSAKFLGVNTQSLKVKESQVHIAIGGTYKGYYAIKNAYRNGIFGMLDQLKKTFSLYLISGDADSERNQLYPYFKDLKFRQSPEDKFRYAHQLKQHGPTIMIGDGLNDAGALKTADVGIAVTDDVHQFSPACDAIINGTELTRLNQLVGFCQYAFKVVKIALFVSIMYNLVGLYFAVTAQLTPILSAILMPVSSVSVVGLVSLLIKLKADRLLRE